MLRNLASLPRRIATTFRAGATDSANDLAAAGGRLPPLVAAARPSSSSARCLFRRRRGRQSLQVRPDLVKPLSVANRILDAQRLRAFKVSAALNDLHPAHFGELRDATAEFGENAFLPRA